jgi:hypothetical protein
MLLADTAEVGHVTSRSAGLREPGSGKRAGRTLLGGSWFI